MAPGHAATCTSGTSWRRRFEQQPDPRGSWPTSGGGGRSRTSSCFARSLPPRDSRIGRPTRQTGGATSRGSVSTPPWRGARGTGVRPCRSRTACDGRSRARGPTSSRGGHEGARAREVAIGAPAVVSLAAGVGRRYGGSKQIEPLGPAGATLLDYSIYDAVRAGFGTVVLVIRDELEAAERATIGARWGGGGGGRPALVYARQRLDDVPAGPAVPSRRSDPWGTSPAELAAACQVRAPSRVPRPDELEWRATHTV